MKIVTDSSVFLAAVLNEPEKAGIIEVTAGHDLIAPEVLPFELGNALSSLYRRKRLDASDVLRVWDYLMDIPVELKAIEVRSALEIAIGSRLYAYDAYFLECARHWRCPLLTLDHSLAVAAKTEGIQVLEI
jgi:predicted nucleic acid-binding protein